MNDYKVKIREILERTVTVKAESMAHAKHLVEKGYKNSDYVLDASDYKGVSFHAQYPRDKDYER